MEKNSVIGEKGRKFVNVCVSFRFFKRRELGEVNKLLNRGVRNRFLICYSGLVKL